jgi:hypothetical protein
LLKFIGRVLVHFGTVAGETNSTKEEHVRCFDEYVVVEKNLINVVVVVKEKNDAEATK